MEEAPRQMRGTVMVAESAPDRTETLVEVVGHLVLECLAEGGVELIG